MCFWLDRCEKKVVFLSNVFVTSLFSMPNQNGCLLNDKVENSKKFCYVFLLPLVLK